MRIIFMGTSAFALPALRLLAAKHDVVTVFTQCPKAQGRGMKLTLSPVHNLALTSNIQVYTPTSLRSKESIELVESIQADVIVVCSYGFIVPKAILELKKYGCLNIHPSSLPKYRGAAPLQHTIINGDASTHVCIMQMDEGLDTGPIILQKQLDLKPNILLEELHDQCAEIGAQLLIQALENIDTLAKTPQSNVETSYASKLSKQDGKIDWNKSAWQLDCQIRGMNPWPGTYFLYEGEQIKLLEATFTPLEHNLQPGTVMNDNLLIACGKDALLVKRLQKAGSKPLQTEDFLRGYKIRQNTLLS